MKTKSPYRQMKMIVFYDLPTLTKLDRSNSSKFRINLEKLGFVMMQESIYIKHAYNHDWINRTRIRLNKLLPPKGDIRILVITNKQYEGIEIIRGGKSLQELVLKDNDLIII